MVNSKSFSSLFSIRQNIIPIIIACIFANAVYVGQNQIFPGDDFLRHIRWLDYSIHANGYLTLYPLSRNQSWGDFNPWFGFDWVVGRLYLAVGLKWTITTVLLMYHGLAFVLLYSFFTQEDESESQRTIKAILAVSGVAIWWRLNSLRPEIAPSMAMLYIVVRQPKAATGFALSLVGAFFYHTFFVPIALACASLFLVGQRKRALFISTSIPIGLICWYMYGGCNYIDFMSSLFELGQLRHKDIVIGETLSILPMIFTKAIFLPLFPFIFLLPVIKKDAIFVCTLLTLAFAFYQVRFYLAWTLPLLLIILSRQFLEWHAKIGEYKWSHRHNIASLLVMAFVAMNLSFNMNSVGLYVEKDIPGNSRIVNIANLQVSYFLIALAKNTLQVVPSCDIGYSDPQIQSEIAFLSKKERGLIHLTIDDVKYVQHITNADLIVSTNEIKGCTAFGYVMNDGVKSFIQNCKQ